MMMILLFTSLSTLYMSYQDDGRAIMKGSVQYSVVQSRAEFCLQRDSNHCIDHSAIQMLHSLKKKTDLKKDITIKSKV